MRTINRVIVSGLIISSDGKILFGKKNPEKGGVYADFLHIPGGGIEAEDKDELSALRREMKEEVGLGIDQASRVELIDDQGTGQSQKMLQSGEIVLCKMQFKIYRIDFPKKAAQLVAKPGDDIVEVVWLDNTKDALAKANHNLPTIQLFKRLGWI